MTSHILVIDDDKRLLDLLARFLKREGFIISTAPDTSEAAEILKQSSVDALVLDVLLPQKTGTEFTRELRKHSNLPILLLTALGEPEHRIEGLESGASDYLTKPFEPRELLLRLRNLLKNNQAAKPREIHFGPYTLNFETGKLHHSGTVVALGTTETTLLLLLAHHANQPISREIAAKHLNGISERSVDVQITRLRKRLETGSNAPQYIETVRGKGYRLLT